MHPSGFRRNHSTGFCLGQTLIDFVLTGTDKQIPNDMILVDLKKAFDTWHHVVLSEKMKDFGFWTSVIKWFKSQQKQKICQTENLWLVLIIFCLGWNIFLHCSFFFIYRWSSAIIISSWLLFECRWHLYFLSTRGR